MIGIHVEMALVFHLKVLMVNEWWRVYGVGRQGRLSEEGDDFLLLCLVQYVFKCTLLQSANHYPHA